MIYWTKMMIVLVRPKSLLASVMELVRLVWMLLLLAVLQALLVL